MSRNWTAALTVANVSSIPAILAVFSLSGDIGGFLIIMSALTPKATTWFVEPVVEVWNAK
jgi:hypothetical protein